MKLLFVFLLLSAVSHAQAQLPEVAVHGSEIRKFTSNTVAGQEYELQIMLPAGYSTSTEKYPVVYLMDSQWDFALLSALYGEQYYDGFIPKMIIVGVTWGGSNPNPDSLRARDYTPTKEQRLPQSGGAEKFLSVLQKEVFPLVEATYKADAKDRTLVGCSLGGLFTMYALFTQPNLFQRYVAASPAFMWDNEVLYQYSKTYFQNKNNPSAKLFMCVGGVERSVLGFKKLTDYLATQQSKNLQVQSRVLENTGHSGTKGEGYARGLQFVFAKPVIHPSAAVLNKYLGKYELEDNSKVELKAENDQLVLYFSPTNKYILQAANENSFYATAEFLNIDFIVLQDTVTGFQIEGYGKKAFAKKLK